MTIQPPDDRFLTFSDDELINELKLRKRLLNVEGETELPTRYLSDFSLGYVQRKTIEMIEDPLIELALKRKIEFRQERKPTEHPDFTKFHVKIWVLVA